MQALIGSVCARKILDSRGNPTIEVDVTVQDEAGMVIGSGRAAAPSGASKGKYEVIAFPKGGVGAAIEKVERIIAPKLVGMDCGAQEQIDGLLRELDGTPNLRRLGGNTTVAISMAVAKAAASVMNLPLYKYLGGELVDKLPCPLGNVLGGGAHAGRGAPDIQEFLAVPIGAKSFADAAFANAQVHREVGSLIEAKDRSFTGGKGDEGAWAPNLDNLDALNVVVHACKRVSNKLGFKISPGLDIAASSLYNQKKRKYVYKREGKLRSTGEQIDFVIDLIKTYKLLYVEDPLHEDDFKSFALITRKIGKKCLICGDDLFVTNINRIQRGVKSRAANAVLIKPNQIGTLTDALKAVELAREHGYVPVMSHRSGETSDWTIAHLAVGFGCPLIKTGVVGGERIAKLNELIWIEQELGETARMGELSWK